MIYNCNNRYLSYPLRSAKSEPAEELETIKEQEVVEETAKPKRASRKAPETKPEVTEAPEAAAVEEPKPKRTSRKAATSEIVEPAEPPKKTSRSARAAKPEPEPVKESEPEPAQVEEKPTRRGRGAKGKAEPAPVPEKAIAKTQTEPELEKSPEKVEPAKTGRAAAKAARGALKEPALGSKLRQEPAAVEKVIFYIFFKDGSARRTFLFNYILINIYFKSLFDSYKFSDATLDF